MFSFSDFICNQNKGSRCYRGTLCLLNQRPEIYSKELALKLAAEAHEEERVKIYREKETGQGIENKEVREIKTGTKVENEIHYMVKSIWTYKRYN